MKKIWLLRVVNLVLFVAVLWQGVTGLGHVFLGHEFIEDEVFSVLHTSGGVSLLVLAAIHLLLNWNWIRTNYFGKHSKV